MNGKTMKSRLLASSVFAGAAIGLVATPAIAQEEDAEARQQTITITGSRIAKADFVSNSPINTVGAEQFELTGTVNTESLLNTLPQTVPGLDRTSNNPGNGTATVDLRGLGSNRTLVLVNGRRMVPTNGGVVDINNIPPALVERVEVVTGGASAVYGADAVSGVVNFILKDDFEGVEATAGYEVTQEGDAEIWSTSLTMGGNFADDRGNAVVSLTYADRAELFQGDRDFASVALFDNANNDGLEPGGSSGIPGTSIFAGGLGTFSPSSGIVFNPDGSISPFRTSGEPNDFYNYAPVNYIQLPQERFTATGMASYDITEDVEAYGQFMFANNRVPQQLAPTPIFQTAQFSLDGNPFIDAAAQQVLSDAIGDGVDTDGDGIDDTATGFLRRRMLEVGPRIVDSGFNAFQFTGGLRGDINENIAYDVYFQEGRVEASFAQSGNVSRTAFNQALLLADADGDGNVDAGAGCADPSNGCSPLNIFGEGNISDAAAQFVSIRVNGDFDYDQTVFNATLSGDTTGWFELPGGPIGIAGGVEYREDQFELRPSQDLATGNIAGFNGQAPQPKAGYDVYEGFVEAYLPILADVEFADILALDLAFRQSEYSSIGSASTYRIGGEWAPNEQLRFRTSYNTAVRAPNINELFGPQDEGFPGADDPCAADGGFVGDASVRAICEATGVPAANVFSPVLNPASGQVRAVGGGNPDLDAEEATTLTLGFVASPDFVPGLTFAVDYFDIEVEDTIAAFGGGANNILNTCYTDAALGGAGSLFCSAVNRRPDGTIDFVQTSAQNAASLELRGVDVTADYSIDLEDMGFASGDLALTYIGTFTDKNDFTPFDGAETITCAGEFGADCGEPVPEYKHRATARWANGGPLTAQLAWRYVGSVDDDNEGTVFFADEIDGTHYFDLSGSYRFNDNFSLTGGIDNLLDEEPPIIGDNDEQSNTYPATYDVFGRTFFLRATATF